MAFKIHPRLSWGVMVATAVSMPLMAAPSYAAESIIVRYKSDEVTVTRQQLNTFTNTGEIPPDLQKLIGEDISVPEVVRSALAEKITIPKFVERFIEGSNGDFLLLKLDEAISSASGNTQKDLEDIKTAVLDAIADNQVSFMELIDKHPQARIRVDLTSLEGTYKDVRGFVERVLPALEVAKGLLQDVICDCEQAETSPQSSPGPADDKTPRNYQSSEVLFQGTEAEKCKQLKSLEATLKDQPAISDITSLVQPQ